MQALGLAFALALLLGPRGGGAAPAHVLQPDALEMDTSRDGRPWEWGHRHHSPLIDRDSDGKGDHEERHATARPKRAKNGAYTIEGVRRNVRDGSARQGHGASRAVPPDPMSDSTSSLERMGPAHTGSVYSKYKWRDFRIATTNAGLDASATIIVDHTQRLGQGSYKTAWKGQMIYHPPGDAEQLIREEVAVAESEVTGRDSFQKSEAETKVHRDIYNTARSKGQAGNILAIYGSQLYRADRRYHGIPVVSEEDLSSMLDSAEYVHQTAIEQRILWKEYGGFIPRELQKRIPHFNLRYVLVVEACAGELRAQIGRADYAGLDPQLARRTRELEVGVVMRQFLKGLKALHDMNVAHSDIKSINALLKTQFDPRAFHRCASAVGTVNAAADCLAEDSVKVMDFGLVNRHANVKKKSCKSRRARPCWKSKGTSSTMAPELLYGKYKGDFTSLSTDIYSTAVMWYRLANGGKSIRKVLRPAVQEASNEKVWEALSRLPSSLGLKCLLHSMLNKEPNDRPKVDELLNHPYFETELPLFEGILEKYPMNGKFSWLNNIRKTRHFVLRRSNGVTTLSYYALSPPPIGKCVGSPYGDLKKTLRIDNTVKWSRPGVRVHPRLKLQRANGDTLVMVFATDSDRDELQLQFEAAGVKSLDAMAHAAKLLDQSGLRRARRQNGHEARPRGNGYKYAGRVNYEEVMRRRRLRLNGFK